VAAFSMIVSAAYILRDDFLDSVGFFSPLKLPFRHGPDQFALDIFKGPPRRFCPGLFPLLSDLVERSVNIADSPCRPRMHLVKTPAIRLCLRPCVLLSIALT